MTRLYEVAEVFECQGI